VIYAIRVRNHGQHYIKFGRAKNVEHRLSSLQGGSPYYRLRLMGAGNWPDAEERRIHSYLWTYRARGEWFKEGPATDHVIALLVDPDGLSKWRSEVLLPLPQRLACVYSVCKSVS
jgi:hypothetical protein